LDPFELSKEATLKFWLEEYKALSADIQARVGLQQGLLNFQILLVAALIGFFGTNVKEDLDFFSAQK
jgi:hypothetical protein